MIANGAILIDSGQAKTAHIGRILFSPGFAILSWCPDPMPMTDHDRRAGEQSETAQR